MVNWHLLPGEKAIFQTETSWKVFMKYYLLAFLFLTLSIAVWFFGFITSATIKLFASIFLVALFFIWFMIATLKRRHEMVLITTERVLIRKGTSFASQTNVEAVTYNNLINVSVQQTRMQKILGIGDVHFKLSGEEHVMTDIDNPFGIERAVYKIIEKEKEIGKIKQK